MITLKDKTGYFVFSLDTELAWGYFDSDQLRRTRFSSDGTRERESVKRLLDTLDEFGIVATWAVVGHMFYESCEHCAICPLFEWKGKYRSFEDVYETNHPLWYGADVIETLLTRTARHEIAFHGYTHKIFDEDTMSEEEARIELGEWLRIARRKNIVPRAVVFPRNKVGHLRLFEEFDFLCYRGGESVSKACLLPYLGKIRRRLRQLPFFFIPPVYELCTVESCGLVNIPSSPNYFKRDRALNRFFDALNLNKLSMSGAIRGVRRASKENKIIHLWGHPSDFQTEKDWQKLRYLFGYVSEQVRQGKLQSITMGDLARKAYVAQR